MAGRAVWEEVWGCPYQTCNSLTSAGPSQACPHGSLPEKGQSNDGWRRMRGRCEETALRAQRLPAGRRRWPRWPGAGMALQPGEETMVGQASPCSPWRGLCWSRRMRGSLWRTPCHSRWMVPEGAAGCGGPVLEQGKSVSVNLCLPCPAGGWWGGGRGVGNEGLKLS